MVVGTEPSAEHESPRDDLALAVDGVAKRCSALFVFLLQGNTANAFQYLPMLIPLTSKTLKQIPTPMA